jgi:hypothetical protein
MRAAVSGRRFDLDEQPALRIVLYDQNVRRHAESLVGDRKTGGEQKTRNCAISTSFRKSQAFAC